jgi:hypothetical protein
MSGTEELASCFSVWSLSSNGGSGWLASAL